MFHRSVVVAAAILAVGASLSACSTGSTSQGGDDSLTVAINAAIDTWNPQEALAVQSYQVFPQVYASLLKTSPDGSEIEPGLAEAYEFDEGASTITFHLAPAAAFSDGTPLTSDDVVFSEGLWAAGELYGSYFSSVTSVTPVDPHTVVFQLSGPDRALLGVLATSNAAIVPKDYGGQDAETFWKKPIGAGPYAIAGERVGESIDLVKNTHYIGGAQDRPENVDYSVVTDSAQRLLQFQSGKVDIVNGVQLESASQYDQSLLQSTQSSGTSVLIAQTKDGPLADPKFRRALNLSIDHQALIAGGYAGRAEQATSVLPQIVPGVAPCAACDWGKTDVDEAKRLVQESGYDGRSLTLAVSSDSGPEQLAAQALVPMFAGIGVTVTIDAQANSAFIDKLGKGDFDLGAITYSALAPSAIDPLGFLATTSVIFSGSDTAAADTALAAAHGAATPEAAEAATSAFEAWNYENAPVIPLATPNVIYAVGNAVKGFVPNHYTSYSLDGLTLQR